MNIQQLEYIVAVDKHKSFSKAADVCFVTQATLSTMVKKLEEELGIVIFDRKCNPILTTDSGKKIIAEATKVLYHCYRVKDISSELNQIIEGEIRVGVIPTIANSLLHRILPTLLEKFPLLKIEIQELTTQSILNMLKTNEIDVGIAATPLNMPEYEEEILYYEKLLVYGSSNDADTKYRNPRELAHEKIWLLEKGHCLTDQIINVCGLTSKKQIPNLQMQPSSFETLLNMVDQMKGVTLIPELYYLEMNEQRKSKVSDFVAPYPVREISMVYYRPYAKQRIISALSQEITNLIGPLLATANLKNSEMAIAMI